MTKWPVQKLTQGTTQKLLQHHDATDIKKKYIFVFFDFFKCFYWLFLKPTGNVTAFKSETGTYVEESTDWRKKVKLLFLSILFQCFNFVLFFIKLMNWVSNMFWVTARTELILLNLKLY